MKYDEKKKVSPKHIPGHIHHGRWGSFLSGSYRNWEVSGIGLVGKNSERTTRHYLPRWYDVHPHMEMKELKRWNSRYRKCKPFRPKCFRELECGRAVQKVGLRKLSVGVKVLVSVRRCRAVNQKVETNLYCTASQKAVTGFSGDGTEPNLSAP